jgi:hypothetical protein
VEQLHFNASGKNVHAVPAPAPIEFTTGQSFNHALELKTMSKSLLLMRL